MTRISATEEQSFHLDVTPERAFAFFSNPSQFSTALAGLQMCEVQNEGRVHLILEEKRDQGIVFQPNYVVQFENDAQTHIRWNDVSGNMGNRGEVSVTTNANGGCDVAYRETVEPDLPITQLMACLIKPIVTRELRRDVGRFLERAKTLLVAQQAASMDCASPAA